MRFPKTKPTSAPLNARNIGLRLCKAPVDVGISEIGIAEPEPLRLEIHPRRNGEPMSNHVAGHNEEQDKHYDDRTGLGGSRQ